MANRNLRWSDRALEENRKLTIYLLSEWGDEMASKVGEQIEKTPKRIQQTPEQFPLFLKRKNVRRSVISAQTSIFFRVYRAEIVIISVFDNRQSPKRRKL
jgi:plasmid stabilization system protein ParE